MAAGTSLNLPNLPDSDPELTAAACYLYWNVRHELVRSVAAIIASSLVSVDETTRRSLAPKLIKLMRVRRTKPP